jgi:hypothetical protein
MSDHNVNLSAPQLLTLTYLRMLIDRQDGKKTTIKEAFPATVKEYLDYEKLLYDSIEQVQKEDDLNAKLKRQ